MKYDIAIYKVGRNFPVKEDFLHIRYEPEFLTTISNRKLNTEKLIKHSLINSFKLKECTCVVMLEGIIQFIINL